MENGESYYVPEWVKKDRRRFFRARFPDGCETATISPFCVEAVAKDCQAFVRMMTWLKEHDEHHTVLMIQVENEIGLLGADRDHCDAACMAWQKPIPAEAQDVLGLTGCWENYPHLGEVFMAWQYAQDLEIIASAGKAVLPLPMYGSNPKARTSYPLSEICRSRSSNTSRRSSTVPSSTCRLPSLMKLSYFTRIAPGNAINVRDEI